MSNLRTRIERLEDEVVREIKVRIIVHNPIPGLKGKPVPGEPNAIMIERRMPAPRRRR